MNLFDILGIYAKAKSDQRAAQTRRSSEQITNAGQTFGAASSMNMSNDWQRLYAELGQGTAAPIAQQQQQPRQPLQLQQMESPQIQMPEAQQPQQEQQDGMGQMLMGAGALAAAMSDPSTKVIHDRMNQQFAQAAEPITYEYKPEAQAKFGLPGGIRQGVDARRLAEEGGPLGDRVTAETEDGLKVLLPDEGLGVAMSQAAQANVANQRQDMQMKRMMEALDARMYEMELRNRMRAKV